MGVGEAVTVAGIGCRRGVSVAAVLAAVEAARGGRRLDALATVPAKRGEPALAEAARRLGLPLLVGAVADGDPRLAQPLRGVAGGDRQRLGLGGGGAGGGGAGGAAASGRGWRSGR